MAITDKPTALQTDREVATPMFEMSLFLSSNASVSLNNLSFNCEQWTVVFRISILTRASSFSRDPASISFSWILVASTFSCFIRFFAATEIEACSPLYVAILNGDLR